MNDTGKALPVCGYCGHLIVEGQAALDPRGAAEDGSQRLDHPACEPKHRAMLAESLRLQARNSVQLLVDATVRVWDAYLDYGPVDDGRPEGQAFELALEALRKAAVQAGAKIPGRRKRQRKRERKGMT